MKHGTLETTVAHYIETHKLLDKSRLQLVALSGGADSVALLFILRTLGYQLEAIHCNFQLRGQESVRDERFCQTLCDKLNIPLHHAHFDTRSYAQLHGISIEMAARKLRYTYFNQLREALDAEAICVAHHRDDAVETILLNLIRGTGLHGLTGMKPKNGAIVRPLLCVSRADLKAYLDDIGQDFVTDSSNLVADVKRNKIRLKILPLLEELNPSFRETMMNMASDLKEVEKVVDAHLSHYSHVATLSIKTIEEEPSTELALFYFLHTYGFNSVQIHQISDHLNDSCGRRWLSPTHELLADRDCLTVYPIEKVEPKPMFIPEPGCYVYANDVKLRVTKREKDEGFIIPQDKQTAALDADKVAFPLIIRRTKAGDKFTPLGMNGTKLVSDFLTNQKKSIWEKRHQLIVCDAAGDILWLIGNRLNHMMRITKETKHVLLIEQIE